MLRTTWRRVALFVPSARRRLLTLSVISLLSTLLEAIVVVLVVGTALSLADGSSEVSIELPLVDVSALDAPVALSLAGAGALLALLLHVVVAYLTARLSTEVLQNSRERAVLAFARASWARQSADREGALQETMTSLAGKASELIVQLATLCAAVMGLIALFGVAFVVDPLVTLGVVAFAVVIGVFLRPLIRMTRRSARSYVRSYGEFAELATAWTNLALDLRVTGVEEQEAERLLAQNRATVGAHQKMRFAAQLGLTLYRDIAVILLVVGVAVLHALSDVDLATVGAVVVLILRSLSYAQQTQSNLQGIAERSANLQQLLERVETMEASPDVSGTRPLERLGNIEFRSVGYAYDTGRDAVAGLDFEIEQGEMVAVVGPSGAGKSTLIQLLLGVRRPTTGKILVGGHPYEEYASADWYSRVALVAQEPKLFEGTIRENIAFHRGWIDDGAVERAARAAHVYEDISALPRGMETRLAARGVGLSGGQKQRLAIARALAGRPELLILDEPTSALDGRSEELVQQTIDELSGSITVVVVAHRVSTIQHCDRALALVKGRQIAVGGLDEVLLAVEDATKSATALTGDVELGAAELRRSGNPRV